MTESKEYQIILTQQARKLFSKIKDRREQQLIINRLEKLKINPEQQGKALSQDYQATAVFGLLDNVIELFIK